MNWLERIIIIMALLVFGSLYGEPATQSSTFTIPHLDLTNNLNFNILNSQIYGPTGIVTYNRIYNSDHAFRVEIDAGLKQARINGTYAWLFGQNGIKFTAEDLYQENTYNFLSGNQNVWLDQGALGGEYRYFINSSVITSLFLNGWYSQAESKAFSPISYQNLLVQNNIYGGEERNFTLGLGLNPWRNFNINVGIGLDRVYYPGASITEYNDSTIGGEINSAYLLDQWDKISLNITRDVVYDTYKFAYDHIFESGKLKGLDLKVFVQRLSGFQQQFDDNEIGLGMSYNLDGNNSMAESDVDTPVNFESWVLIPAVYREQVIAISSSNIISINNNNFPAVKILTYENITPHVTGYILLNGNTNLVINHQYSMSCNLSVSDSAGAYANFRSENVGSAVMALGNNIISNNQTVDIPQGNYILSLNNINVLSQNTNQLIKIANLDHVANIVVQNCIMTSV